MKTLTCLILFLAGTTAALSQVEVSSSFEPSTVTTGESTLFRINFSSSGNSLNFYRMPPPSIPPVEGLSFQYLGPNQQVRIVNGSTTMQVGHLYRVRTERPGEFKSPAFTVKSGDQDIEIPTATLSVIDRSTQESAAPGEDYQAAWMEVKLPRENLYVGETAPVDVRLLLNSRKIENASLGGEHPEKIGDAFSIGDFSEMTQSRISLDGQPFTVADWKVLLTPLKTGPQPLVFQLPLAVTRRDTNRRTRDPFGSFFGPSLFQQMFNRQELLAYSDDREIEILPLPTAGRPADFTGGIGEFQLEETRISGSKVQVGEPFLFSVAVSGKGNFDRIEEPLISNDSGQWREYDPETSFTPRDELGYSGVKNFTYTLIPLSEDIKATPTFTFSYFSPETGNYNTVTIPPTPIQVEPAPPGSLPPPKPEASANPVEARRGPDLLPVNSHWSPGGPSPLCPLFYSPWFYLLQGILLSLLLSAFAITRHRARLRDDPNYAKRHRARKASKRFLDACKAHAASGETDSFFQSATRAIQETVGPFQRREPESLTEDEVIHTLESLGSDPEILTEIRSFFQASETIQYSGKTITPSDLLSDYRRLTESLRTVHSRKSAKVKMKRSGANLLLLLFIALLWSPPLLRGQEDNSSTPAPDEETQTSPDPESLLLASNERTFDLAVANYQSGKFEEAEIGFRSLLGENSSSTLYYNLANTLYRLREYPEAILFYERAFSLSPTNPDIRANLQLAREAASVEPPEDPFLAAIGYRLAWSTWIWLTVIGFWGCAATLLLAGNTRLPGLWRKALLFLFGVTLLVAIAGQVPWISTSNRAIVLSPKTPLRLAPTASSPLDATLTAGSIVKTGEIYGEFQRVHIGSDNEGWVLQSALEPVIAKELE